MSDEFINGGDHMMPAKEGLMHKRIKAPAVKTGECPGPLRRVGGLRRIDLEEYEPGIYFLCNFGEVVYVGQSTNPKQRISTHLAEKKKVFDRAFIRHCRPDELDELESFFIHTLEPKYNCTMPSGQKLAPKTMQDIAATARQLTGRESRPQAQAQDIRNRSGIGANDRLLRLPDVMAMTGLRKSAIYAAMKDGRFPAPRKWGRSSMWLQAEVAAWVHQVIEPAPKQAHNTPSART